MAEVSELFELRSASMTLVALVLRSVDLERIEAGLDARLRDTPELFSDDAVLLDLASVEGEAAALDFERLLALLRSRKMLPVAVRGGSPAQMAAALQAGLAAVENLPAAREPTRRDAASERIANLPASDETVPATPVAIPVDLPLTESGGSPPAGRPLHVALVVDRPLRSGQQVYARGGDLVVLAAVNFGAEVIADGSIHVYAPLRGKAIAGAKGNAAARIYSTCMDAELVSIAGTYRTTENPLPSDVVGKPAQIRLDGERLVFEPLG